MKKLILNRLKGEVVLCVAIVLAVFSMFIVPPSAKYVDYIDFRVLALLFCLMMVVAGLRSVGVFEKMGGLLTGLVKNTRQLVLVLVLICFVLSMWITNDVALITFVPFAIMVLDSLGKRKYIMITVILQTIAANLGSMCTPVGNPQNLYLYTISNMSVVEFIKLMLPYTVVSLVLLVFSCIFVKKEAISVGKTTYDEKAGTKKAYYMVIIYIAAFLVCILTVLRLVHYLVMLAVVVCLMLLFSREQFKRVDYALLLTFVAFFIFVGNARQIDVVNSLLQKYVEGNVVIVSVLVSQVISNVPAAMLLSGFTADYRGLLIGTNMGGLGTLIASMASLISYKFYAKESDSSKSRYILLFTALNVVYLIILLLVLRRIN